MQGMSAVSGGAAGLTRRELAVLEEVVGTYLRTGEPVPSARVARSARVALSPATVRRVMAGLEERGLLRRPHASAGRVPTDASLRLYVQLVRQRRAVPRRARRRLEEGLRRGHREASEDLRWLARLLAEITEEAAMLVRPLGDEPLVEGVFLAPLATRRALAVVVTAGGTVVRRAIRLEEPLDADALREIANRLTEATRGRPVGEVRAALEREEDLPDGGGPLADRRTRRIGREVFSRAGEPAELVLVGTERLLESPDFERVERVRALLEAVGDRERMAALLRDKLAEERVRVIIGDESDLTSEGRLGIVATVYFRAGRRAGAVGVVGPRRMDYARVVPIVEYVGRAVTDMLDDDERTEDA